MGLDVMSQIVVGYRKDDIFRKKRVINQETRFDIMTGQPNLVDIESFIDELLVHGTWKEFSVNQIIEYEKINLIFHQPVCGDGEGIIFGIRTGINTDMRCRNYTILVDVESIEANKKLLTEMFGVEPLIFNQLILSY